MHQLHQLLIKHDIIRLTSTLLYFLFFPHFSQFKSYIINQQKDTAVLCGKSMLDQFLEIFKLSISGIISLITTYIVLTWQSKRKEVTEGIAFYREILPHVLPIFQKVSQLEASVISLKTATENMIKGKDGFPVYHVDEGTGIKYLPKDELQSLIKKQSEELLVLTNSSWFSILPANLTISTLMIASMVNTVAQQDWNTNPTAILSQLKEIRVLLNDYELSKYKMLGLLPAYLDVHKQKPEIQSKRLKGLLEDKNISS